MTTGDELGELAATMNQAVKAARERQQIREAFGTYLDKDVARFILSGNFPEEGVEVDVSVLFFDVRDFTQFASQAGAREVVAELNNLFELTVPIISRHGGHVDKFVGDGLIAIFGPPEPDPDHAERAVRAGCEMVHEINGEGETAFRIGAGVNSGPVVAGSIGGAGRLNFSVIGDAVNVAARVEADHPRARRGLPRQRRDRPPPRPGVRGRAARRARAQGHRPPGRALRAATSRGRGLDAWRGAAALPRAERPRAALSVVVALWSL